MKSESIEKAKKYAFLLLKYRPRSERELYSRLKKKKFEEAVIACVISFLKERKFLDDRAFAQAWIESRIKSTYGLRKIEQELKLKGIDKEIIATLISELKQGYPEEKVAAQIAEERFKKLKRIEINKARRRVYDYLVRRGFSPGIAIEVIRGQFSD